MNTRNFIIGLAALFGVFSMGIVLFSNAYRIEAWLRTYHLLPEPERFTELYFTEHMELPQNATPGAEVAFRFAIHNMERRPFRYEYEITTETSTSGKRQADAGSIQLDHDETETIDQKVRLNDTVERTKISVHLRNKEQPIHFWLAIQ